MYNIEDDRFITAINDEIYLMESVWHAINIIIIISQHQLLNINLLISLLNLMPKKNNVRLNYGKVYNNIIHNMWQLFPQKLFTCTTNYSEYGTCLKYYYMKTSNEINTNYSTAL